MCVCVCVYAYYRGGATCWHLRIIWWHLVLLRATTSFPPGEQTIIRLDSPVCTNHQYGHRLCAEITNTVTVCMSPDSCRITARNLGSALEVCDFSWAGQVVALALSPFPSTGTLHSSVPEPGARLCGCEPCGCGGLGGTCGGTAREDSS